LGSELTRLEAIPVGEIEKPEVRASAEKPVYITHEQKEQH